MTEIATMTEGSSYRAHLVNRQPSPEQVPSPTQQPLDLDALYADLRRVLHSIPQRRYGLSADETDELVQEAWCLFLQKRASVNKPRPWLTGTVVNLCKQHFQRESRYQPLGEDESWDTGRDDSDGRTDVLALQQGLARIDARSRRLCMLIGIEGHSYEEVSDEIGLPIGSIGPLFIRAKSKLRKAMEIQH